MLAQSKWCLVVLAFLVLSATGIGALRLDEQPNPVLKAEFVGEVLRIQLTNQGEGWLRYRLRGYAESGADLREEHWSVLIVDENGLSRLPFPFCSRSVAGWAWLGPGESVSKELSSYLFRPPFGKPDQYARVETTVRIGSHDQKTSLGTGGASIEMT